MTVTAPIHPLDIASGTQKPIDDDFRSIVDHHHRDDADSSTTPNLETPKPRHPSDRQFLSFMIPGATQVMLSLTQLMETLKLTSNDIVGIPDMPPEIVGVSHLRGEVLWLMDLGYFLNQTPLYRQSYRQAHYNIVVVKHQGHTLGLVVQDIGEILWHNLEDIYPIDSVPELGKVTPCLEGCWLTPDGRTLWFLDCLALFHALAIRESP